MALAEIQQLLQQLEQNYPKTTPLQKQVVVTEALKHIESNPTFKARAIRALKAGGTEALKELGAHPLIDSSKSDRKAFLSFDHNQTP